MAFREFSVQLHRLPPIVRTGLLLSAVPAALLLTLPVSAQHNGAQDNRTQDNRTRDGSAMQEGIAAFNRSEYQRALDDFRRAEQEGNTSKSLQYNIAVSLYRLGYLDQARQYFEALAQEAEWTVLANYNLGLVAESAGDMATARRYFESSATQQEHERVREAAARKLAAQRSPVSQPRRWAAITSLSGGWDSNATSLADDLLESRSRADDYYHEQLIYGHWQATGRARDGARVYGLVYNRGFGDFNYLNSQVLSLGSVYELPWRGFATEAGVRTNVTRLDDRRVAEQYQMHLGASREIGGATLSGRYAFSRFEAAPRFRQIHGYQHRLDVDWRRRVGDMALRIRYRYDINDREDLRRGGAFASYSPERHGIRVESRYHFTDTLNAALQLEHRNSRFDGINRLRDTNGEVRERGRVSRQNRVTLDTNYRLTSNWRLRGEYQYTDQRDNFALYTFDKHRVSATIEYRW